MAMIDEILSKLGRVTAPDTQGWRTARCPFHDDHAPSLRLNDRGFKCMACGESGGIRKLAEKLGIDLPSNTARSASGGLTLTELAANKGLPLDALQELGWRDVEVKGRPAVAIPYFDPTGELIREQIRVRLIKTKGRKKDNRFFWGPGHGIAPLGLDRLQIARESGYILIVEGATDYAACVSGGISALALPGANTWKTEWGKYLSGIKRVVVWREADDGGNALIRSLVKSGIKFLVVEAPSEAEDPCVVRQLDPAAFPSRMNQLMEAAQPPDPELSEDRSSEQLEVVEMAKGSAADRAIAYVIGSGAELFYDQHGDGYIAVRNQENRREVWPLKSKAASGFIRWFFYTKEEKGLSSEALATARATLAAKARFQGERRSLEVRVARKDEESWFDLGDWRAVKITATGWSIVDNPPVMFRHYQHQLPQVLPSSNGSFDALEGFLDLLNVGEGHHRLLLKIYLVAGFMGGVSLPILIVHGEQGSAKSMLQKLLRLLLDPSSLETLAPPDSLREFVQLAAHHRVVFLDNLSSLPTWLSDAFCRLCTGESFSKRELFSDDDDVIYSFRGLGGINGINLVATKSDLLDRGMLLNLKPISRDRRMPEKVVFQRFEAIRPQVLGALFDGLAKAMHLVETVDLQGQLPRLADFAVLGAAISEALGHSKEEFLEAYAANVDAQNEAAVEESAVGQAVMGLLEEVLCWEGTAGELLHELESRAEGLQINTRARTWPKAPNVLANKLREVAPNLRAAGISLMDRRVHGIRRWTLSCGGPERTAPITPIATFEQVSVTNVDIDDKSMDRHQNPLDRHPSPPDSKASRLAGGGGGDGGDEFPASTGRDGDTPSDPWNDFLKDEVEP